MCRRILAVAFLGIFGTVSAPGQFADTYRQAAQAFNNAAAQCQSPAGAACLRQNANYYNCLANQLGGGGSCGSSPSCSTSCTGSGSGSGGAGSAVSGLTQKQQLALSGLSLAIQWLGNRHHNDGADQPSNDAQIAADNARAQLAIAEANVAFSNEVALRNALTSGADPSMLGNTPAQSPDDPTVALRNQLTAANGSSANQPMASNTPPDTSDDTPVSTPADTATGAPPIANSSAPSAGTPPTENSPVEPAPDPSITQPVPGYVNPFNQQSSQAAMTPPSTSPMSPAFQQSNDDPSAATPTVADGVMNSLKAIPGQIKDGLENVMAQVSSVKTSLTNLWNDPSVQMMNSIRTGDYTTAPLPNSTDTPDEALNKTFAQSVLGFGEFKDGFTKGLYNYGTKMVDQMGAYLGLAYSQISSGDPQ
jgi:hypothetical protein